MSKEKYRDLLHECRCEVCGRTAGDIQAEVKQERDLARACLKEVLRHVEAMPEAFHESDVQRWEKAAGLTGGEKSG